MSENQRQYPLHGGGNSPAFSSDDVALARGMQIEIGPSDVAELNELLAELPSIQNHRRDQDQIDILIREQYCLRVQIERWKTLAFLSVPVLAIETALLLWIVTR